METLTELFREIESLEAIQYEIDNGTHLASVVERIIIARDNHKEYLALNSDEFEAKYTRLETDSLILEMKLSSCKSRFANLLHRYRSLAKYSRKLIKQSIEDLRYYDFENKH